MLPMDGNTSRRIRDRPAAFRKARRESNGINKLPLAWKKSSQFVIELRSIHQRQEN